jgi:hypothetical protein
MKLMSQFPSYRALTFLGVACLLGGCAASTQPVFYPNDQFQKAGAVQADVDRSYCVALADNYVKQPDKYVEIGKSGAVGGVIGAGTGALAGTIMKGAVGRSTAAGAAVGAIVAIASEATKQSGRTPSYERFVEYCLQKKGYEIIGWE